MGDPKQHAHVVQGLPRADGRHPFESTTDVVGEKSMVHPYFKESTKGAYGV
jgi:hypothetical protein